MRTAVVVPGNGAVGADGVYRISERCRLLVVEAETLAASLSPVAVVFSGWSPVGGSSEAEQMERVWRGPSVELVVEAGARSTVENASRTLPLLLEREVECAVIVCAALHVLRAGFFFRRLYGPRGIGTRFRLLREAPSLGSIARELGAFPLAPLQLRAARRAPGRRPT
jgi:uncharacterized SAM-binding protein YcdF (DUF218 family)